MASLVFGALLVAGLVRRLKGTIAAAAELRARQATIVQAERHWSALIQNVSDIIAVIDGTGRLLFVSPAITTLLGVSETAALGTPLYAFVHADDVLIARTVIEQAHSPNARIQQEWRMTDASGAVRTCEARLTNLLDNPDVGGILVTLRDVTERDRFEQELTHQAFHDALTGLPNRALVTDRIRGALERSKRSGESSGLLFIDLDNFKYVNDSLGHDEGDRLLVELAARFKACVRGGDTVARLGGDEFTILMEDVAVDGGLVRTAEAILASLRQPVVLDGRTIVATASIGMALSDSSCTPASLLRDADTAMYHAKTSGKASYALFNRAMSAKVIERLDLEGELRTALAGHQMHLVYQPICELASGRVTGIEALLRWQHPTRGLIAPLTFIPIAEETGLILPLGEWVLRTACLAAADWVAAGDVPETFTVSVNVSMRQLLEQSFVERVLAILAETKLAARHLKLEITESVIMQNLEDCVLKMRQLQQAGVRFAIDDFGTGYSSMAYLSSLPVDTLKIDRSFINRIGGEGDGNAIIQAIMTMAQALSLNVTSEGIETSEQLRFLNVLGCQQGQGYLFAKPLEAARVAEFLALGAADVPAADSRAA
ncbi:MAG: putative bifunctional diguanylate cyclase/phosphodiesterase [Fimbriimonadaceae bacterium]